MSAPEIADRLAYRIGWPDIDTNAVRELIRMARDEDLSGWGLARPPDRQGDVTSQSLHAPDRQVRFQLVAREQLVACGLPLIPLILEAYGDGCCFEPGMEDGHKCRPGQVIGTLSGSSGNLLQAERVMLNFLQRLSGVASLAHQYVEAMGSTATRLLDTRKTTPGFRVLEKYAVACGGGYNHRMGLFDRVMLKDNHLAAAGADRGTALAGLVRSTRERWPGMVIELEVDRIDQIEPGLAAGVDVFLLDNFSKADLLVALEQIGSAAATEASGGITRESLPGLASIGLDFISTGATVHKATWKDIGLDWVEGQA